MIPRLDFLEDYILENERVLLSPLKLGHIDKLSEISNEQNIWTYFIENGKGFKNLTNYVQSTINNRKSEKEYPFVVFDKIKNKYAGTTRFYDYLYDLKNIKLGHTWYGKEFRGTGLNKHCKYLLFEFAFEKLGLERIGFGAHIENKISILAMESVGCKKEGVLRGFLPAMEGHGRSDIVLLSILKNEWDNNIKLKLKNKLKVIGTSG